MSATMIETDRESDRRTLAQLLGFLQQPIDLTPPPLAPALPFGLGFRPNPTTLILHTFLQRPMPPMADMPAKTFAEVADAVSARDPRRSGPKAESADILLEPAPEEQRFVARMVAIAVDATEAEEPESQDRIGRYGFFTPDDGSDADEEHVRVSELSAAFNANLLGFDADDTRRPRGTDDEDGEQPGKAIYL